MSDLSVTIHNFEDLITGKTDFAGFAAGEVKLFEENIDALPEVLQGATKLMLDAFKAAASVLVGAGQTAIGPLIAESSDAQATMILNLLQAAGVRTSGVLTAAEHAALVAILNGLKAAIDRVGLQITTQGVTPKPAAVPQAPAA
jgi:hypothetical protein